MFRSESFPSFQGCRLPVCIVPAGFWLQTGPCMASGCGLPHDRNLKLPSGRDLAMAEEVILKAKEMEAEGIDPPTSRMRSGRSTI